MPSARPAYQSPPDLGQQVLIVDASAVTRAMVARMIDASDHFATAGSVPTVAAAHLFLARHRVEIVILDLDMPGADALAALPGLIAAGRGARVLVVSGLAGHGAAAVQALALGAADALVKPESRALDRRFAETLLDRLVRMSDGQSDASSRPTTRPAAPPRAEPTVPVADALSPFDLIAIGASTGGIHALSQVLRALPVKLRTPILVTQHLPANFMPYFAAQLAVLAGRPCQVAHDHTRIQAGHLYVAPGDAHLRCVRMTDEGVALRLLRQPAASGCMPSVDPMLASAAEIYGSRLLAIVLSGMGRDGAAGAHVAHRAGAAVVVQDQSSSVIWGMPGAVAAAGDADAVLSPEAIGALIAGGRRP